MKILKCRRATDPRKKTYHQNLRTVPFLHNESIVAMKEVKLLARTVGVVGDSSSPKCSHLDMKYISSCLLDIFGDIPRLTRGQFVTKLSRASDGFILFVLFLCRFFQVPNVNLKSPNLLDHPRSVGFAACDRRSSKSLQYRAPVLSQAAGMS